jgi:hypothetical protein
VWQKPSEIFLSQSRYVVGVLHRFEMLDCNSMTTPMIYNMKKLYDQASGSHPEDPIVYRHIIDVSSTHQMDMCYVVNSLSQFMCEPIHIHMVSSKHILRYSRGNIAYGRLYTFSGGAITHGNIC